jgi:hypothetical protein
VPSLPPTPLHDLKYRGGKTIQSLYFANFYIGVDSWNAGDIKNIDTTLSEAMSDLHLNNVMAQYFTGPITTTFLGSMNLPGIAPQLASQGDIEQLVIAIFNQGILNGIDLANTVFNFLLPPGTVLSTGMSTTSERKKGTTGRRVDAGLVPMDADDSLNGLGGYHGSVHIEGSNTVYYCTGVYSQTEADGTVNGISVFDQPWKNVVATFYHELNEARTDPDVEDSIHAGNDPGADAFLGWVSDQGEECGDFPLSEAGTDVAAIFQQVPLTDKSATVPVQFQYSNAVHGPEGPIPNPH